jgi:hypothetical protein
VGPDPDATDDSTLPLDGRNIHGPRDAPAIVLIHGTDLDFIAIHAAQQD